MSGNGREWTRSLGQSDHVVPLANPTTLDFVQLRGRKFRDPTPVTYEDLEKEGKGHTEPVAHYQSSPPDTGFRAALEP
jgi:hypothetical protein